MKLFVKFFDWLKKNYLWVIFISIVIFGLFYPDDSISPDINENALENQMEYYEETDEMEPEVQPDHPHEFKKESKHIRGFYPLATVVAEAIIFVVLIYRITNGS